MSKSPPGYLDATPRQTGWASPNHVTKSNHHCYLTYQLSATQAIYPLSSSRQPRNRAPRSPPQYSRKQTDNLHQFLFLLTTSLLDAIRSSLRTFAAERNRQSPPLALGSPKHPRRYQDHAPSPSPIDPSHFSQITLVMQASRGQHGPRKNDPRRLYVATTMPLPCSDGRHHGAINIAIRRNGHRSR